MQARLLRVLQERCFYRVGGNRVIPFDARLVTATSSERIEARDFRRDLYYRLAEYVIQVPPLRMRRGDILYLANRFLIEMVEESGKDASLSLAVQDLLFSFNWPGNVRELRNVVRSAVLQCDGIVEPVHLDLMRGTYRIPLRVALEQGRSAAVVTDQVKVTMPFRGLSLKDVTTRCLAECESQIIGIVLREASNNKAEAARILHVDYKTLHTKAKKFGLYSSVIETDDEPQDPQDEHD
jgi:two-component system nitrogen regulation response regulator GlnG